MKALLLLLLPTALVADHVRATREHAFAVALPPAEAFMLFEPAGEKRWAEDWQPVFPVAADAEARAGAVFTVTRPAIAAHPAVTSVWTVVRHEPPRQVEYHYVIPGLRATRITVRCEPAGDRRTRVIVRYVYTGLSADGDEAIGQITDAAFAAMIESWGADVAAYLRRGTPASP